MPVNKLTGKTAIEINAINNITMPQSYEEFGSKNGVVKITDNYGNSRLSTDPYLNKKVQVYYEKDAPNPLNPSEPNWSYYWKQFVDKNNITKFNFVLNSEMIATCGSIQAIGCVHKFQTEVYYRQKASENTGWTENKGLHAFIEVLAHEDEHLQIVKEHWTNG